jgi:nucleoid DNA-binding protein
MEKSEFLEFVAARYGIEQSIVETVVDMVADCLHEAMIAGINVHIDEIGEFQPIPLFPSGINHKNKTLASLSNQNMVSFHPSEKLTNSVA